MTPLPRSVTVSVPGKVMLAGEYTVLGGGPALAATVDHRLMVTVAPMPGAGGCVVGSDLWEGPCFVERGMSLDGFVDEPLLAAVAHGMRIFGVSDLKLDVVSQLDPSFGLGSSSALRLGVLLGLQAHAPRAGASSSRREAMWAAAREAFRLQKEHQRQASGYDVATQLLGGLTLFTPGDGDDWPGATSSFTRREMTGLKDLVHVYVGGAGAPTGPVLRETLDWLDRNGRIPRLHDATTNLLAALGRALARPSDTVGRRGLAWATAAHRGVFTGSPHFPEALADMLATLPGEGEEWSFKTTGAGGEDALLLVGPRSAIKEGEERLAERGWQRLTAEFECQGTKIVEGPP